MRASRLLVNVVVVVVVVGCNFFFSTSSSHPSIFSSDSDSTIFFCSQFLFTKRVFILLVLLLFFFVLVILLHLLRFQFCRFLQRTIFFLLFCGCYLFRHCNLSSRTLFPAFRLSQCSCLFVLFFCCCCCLLFAFFFVLSFDEKQHPIPAIKKDEVLQQNQVR